MRSEVTAHIINEIMWFRERLKIIVTMNTNIIDFRVSAGSFIQLS